MEKYCKIDSIPIPKIITLPLAELRIQWWPGSDALLDRVKALPLEVEPVVRVWGRETKQTRCVGFFSDIARSYPYSGSEAVALPIPEWMHVLINEVNGVFGTDYNGVLVNHYRNGRDKIGAHSDDERTLAGDGSVTSLSLGASRTFRIRNRRSGIVREIELSHGTLLTMCPGFQKHYTHEIPAQARVTDSRYSLTFRKHSPPRLEAL